MLYVPSKLSSNWGIATFLRIIDMEFHRVRGCIVDTGTRYCSLETTLYKHPLRTIIVGH